MKDIIVRAWDSQTAQMLFYNFNNPRVWTDKYHKTVMERSHRQEQLRLSKSMMYLNFDDCDGVRIFENDIVNDSDSEKNYIIVYDYSRCQFYLKSLAGDENDDILIVDIYRTEYKVLGNVHENPELLVR